MNAFDSIANRWLEKKIELNRVACELRSIEDEMIPFATAKEEGDVQVRGSKLKATIGFGLNRTLDAAIVDQLYGDDELRWAAERVFPMKPSISVKELKFFRSNKPDLYAKLAAAVTAKPAKPSVKVEALEQMREAA